MKPTILYILEHHMKSDVIEMLDIRKMMKNLNIFNYAKIFSLLWKVCETNWKGLKIVSKFPVLKGM